MLGYVGMDDQGLGGLEREFDDDLRGIPGEELISIDARHQVVRAGSKSRRIRAENLY